MVKEEDVHSALDHLRYKADGAAQARADRAYVEEFRKVIKAQLMKKHAGKPLGEQEREAYSDPEYIAHLEAIREAVRLDEWYRFKREAASAVIEAWRTQSSNERAKL